MTAMEIKKRNEEQELIRKLNEAYAPINHMFSSKKYVKQAKWGSRRAAMLMDKAEREYAAAQLAREKAERSQYISLMVMIGVVTVCACIAGLILPAMWGGLLR